MNKNWCVLVYLHCSRVAVSRIWVFGPSQSIHCIWAQFSLLSIVHWSSWIHNKHTIFCVWRLHRRTTRSCLRLGLAYFLSKFLATLLVHSACREVSSGGCSSELGAPGFRSWGSPFWIMPPDCLFLSRIRSCTRCILRISWCVPKRSIPLLQLSVE